MKDILSKPVDQCMSQPVFCVKRGETLKKVFEIMDKHGILGLPVVDEEEKVVGIVTESDLIAHVTTLETPSALPLLGSLIYLQSPERFNESLKKHCAQTVEEMMVTPVVSVEEGTSLKEAIDKMAEHKINRLPVVDKTGKLLGILTRSDVVHQLAQLDVV